MECSRPTNHQVILRVYLYPFIKATQTPPSLSGIGNKTMVTPTGKATTKVVNNTTVPFNQTIVIGVSNQSQEQQQTSNATTPTPPPLPTRIRILLLWFNNLYILLKKPSSQFSFYSQVISFFLG
jgi:hypothetical protein